MESELSRQGHAAYRGQGERDDRSRYMMRVEPLGGGERARRERRATALGWFSLGLGVAQLIAPQGVARWIGLSDSSRTRTLLRVVGLREITCGIGLLSNPRAPGWAWARVAGDLMDVALLGSAMGVSQSAAGRTMAAAAGVLAVSAADAQTARDLDRSRHGRENKRRAHVNKAITVNRSPDEVYRFWRDFENLPRFMAHLKAVQSVNGRSHWQAKGPLGTTIEWDADVVEDRPNELITWRSAAGASVSNQGSVRFRPAPGGRGTEVVVELTYEPPAGSLGVAAARLLGEEPAQQIGGDLRRLKQVLETGEVMHSDASIHRGMHAARPSRKSELQTNR